MYIPVNLTIKNKRKLLMGEGIQLKPEQLDGSDQIYLTKIQHNKVVSHRKKNKGLRLKLTPEHIRYLEGTGFFDSLKNKMVSVYQKIKPYIRPALHKSLDVMSDIVKPLAVAELGPVGLAAVDVGSKLGHVGIDRVGDATKGYGVGAFQNQHANFNIRAKRTNQKKMKLEGNGFLNPGY
jgi:hypothetical protein